MTLEEIKEEYTKLAEMIAKFEAQPKTITLSFPYQPIILAHDEEYAGVVLGKRGERSYHLILLPEDRREINWHEANKWVEDINAYLPTRQEQAFLFANLKEQFEGTYYWSSEQHASLSDYPWCQSFGNGSQYHGYAKSSKLRARAIRRVYI